jgi:hypothetical protein
MVKRIMLVLMFAATLSVVGVGITEKAEGWGRWRRPFVTRYYGPPVYYDSYVPYRAYYGPRYYRYGGPYYGYPAYYYGDSGYYYGRGGVSVSFGF